MSPKQPRNGLIELLRFLAGIAIAVYHFEWVYMGAPVYFVHYYIWVEFFFVLSGFFLTANVVKKADAPSDEAYEALRYGKNEFRKLYPLYLLAFLVSFVVGGGVSTPANTLFNLWNAKWEILMCGMFGFGNTGRVYNGGGAPAYIPSLLCASMVLYYLLKHKKTFYMSIGAPAFIFLGYGRIISQYGSLSQWTAYDGWLCAGIIRALAGMSVGTLSYLLVVEWLKGSRTRLAAALAVSLFAVYSLTAFRNYIEYTGLLLHVLAFALLIAAAYHVFGQNSAILSKTNGFLNFLGRLSYPVFLFHYSILILLKAHLPGRSYQKAIIFFLLITLLTAFVIAVAEQFLRKRLMEVQRKTAKTKSGSIA